MISLDYVAKIVSKKHEEFFCQLHPQPLFNFIYTAAVQFFSKSAKEILQESDNLIYAEAVHFFSKSAKEFLQESDKELL